MIINGEYFEVECSRMHPVAPIMGCNRNEIFSVYGRPSYTKIDIWNYWCTWCEGLNSQGIQCGIEISSHNCNFFSITGSIVLDGEVCDLWITYAHNRLFKHWEIS